MKKNIFFRVDLQFADRRAYVENKFKMLIDEINEYLSEDVKKGYPNCCHQLSAEPFIIARLYGLFKIHKSGIPIRPIISTTNCMGQGLISWLLSKLGIITSHLSTFKIKSAHSMFEMLNGLTLSQDSILGTSDFDSTPTSILEKRKE